MPLISDDVAAEVRQQLNAIVNPVRLVHFTQELNLEYGREVKQLLEEVAALSDKISLEVFNFLLDRERVEEFAVERVPATVVCADKDYGVRFYGLPAGYEFSNLLDAIVAISKGDSGLSAASREKLAQITDPVHLQVFVTPT
jgi:glutaredoxin-like protein